MGLKKKAWVHETATKTLTRFQDKSGKFKSLAEEIAYVRSRRGYYQDSGQPSNEIPHLGGGTSRLNGKETPSKKRGKKGGERKVTPPFLNGPQAGPEMEKEGQGNKSRLAQEHNPV